MHNVFSAPLHLPYFAIYAFAIHGDRPELANDCEENLGDLQSLRILEKTQWPKHSWACACAACVQSAV
jgi:hypothetical protein